MTGAIKKLMQNHYGQAGVVVKQGHNSFSVVNLSDSGFILAFKVEH